MKKLIYSILVFSIPFMSFAQVENLSKEILKAYQDRNVEKLKEHASGIFKMAISESFFTDKSIQEDLKAVDSWSGEIKEIRYKTGDMMGKEVTLASVHYADNADNQDEIFTVVLSSVDKNQWVMFSTGLVKETKEEFEKMSLNLADSKEDLPAVTVKKFAIEMATGDTFTEVSEQKIVECIKKLNDDNFFIILSAGDEFLQAAYSESGFTIQYKENEKQFEAEEYFTKDQTIEIFNKYFSNDLSWKEHKWIDANY